MKYCISCMSPLAAYYGVCPVCGYVRDMYAHDSRLIKPETILDNRYYIGKAIYIDDFGASYLGFDEIMQRKVIIRQLIENLTDRFKLENHIEVNPTEQYKYLQKERFISFYNQLSLLSDINSLPEIFTCKPIGEYLYTVYEYISDITLEDYIIRSGRQSYADISAMIFLMVYALRELHSRNMYHGLINTRNLKINSEKIAVICEFPGVEIRPAGLNTDSEIIKYNQEKDVVSVLLLILMAMLGSTEPISRLNISPTYFFDNNIVVPDMLRDFIISAFLPNPSFDLSMDNLFNAMYDNISVAHYDETQDNFMSIPKSVYEAACNAGRKISYCATSLTDSITLNPCTENA